MPDLESYITTMQAAKLLGYTQAGVRRMLRAGRLEGEKRGRVWLVYAPSVQEYQEVMAGRSKHDPWAIGAR